MDFAFPLSKLRGLISISAWDNNHNILHKEGHDVICFSVTLQHTDYSVFFNIFNIILKCVIFGVLLPDSVFFFFYFFFYYHKSQHLRAVISVFVSRFDIAFNHAVPWCVLKYKKKWKLMEADVQLFCFVLFFFFWSDRGGVVIVCVVSRLVERRSVGASRRSAVPGRLSQLLNTLLSVCLSDSFKIGQMKHVDTHL